jgi:signal transduction histidine kinase
LHKNGRFDAVAQFNTSIVLINNKLKPPIMNAHIIARNAPKLHHFSGFRHIFSTLTQEVKVEKPRSAFPSALAHEVRNPLTNINLAIDMLTSTFLGADQKIYIDIIKRASFRINSLVTELITSVEPGEICFDN